MEIGSVISMPKVIQGETRPLSEGTSAQKMLTNSEPQTSTNKSETNETGQKPTIQQIETLVDEMNQMAKASNTRVSFAYSDDIGAMYVRVLDDNTGQVIRQFPSEEAMEFASKMREWVGMLLDKTI